MGDMEGREDPGIRQSGRVILDTSAVVAIFLREPGFEKLIEHLGQETVVGIAGPTLAEAGLVLTARMRQDARPLLLRFLAEFSVTTIAFGDPHWREAVRAYVRYGKGRHRAALNFGDCLSYAVAKLAGWPLLCTGRDFSQTDIVIA